MLLAVVLVGLLALTLAPIGLAQPLDEQKTEAQGDVQRLQERLEDAVERYNYACVKLQETKGQIAENEEALREAEEELAQNKDRLNNRVRAMYMSRHNRFLDVVVNAGNFDEFLVGLDLAKKLGQKDAELVKKVKDSKAKLESAREALAERKAEQEAAKKELAASKSAIESDLDSAEGRLANVEEEIRQAIARREAEAASAAAASSSSSSRRSNPSNPVTRRTKPPGTPHGGVVGVAYAQIGKPYVWGASGPNSFDCSGLTMYCYRVGAGINISHSSYAQAHCGTPVSVSELQPGDIVGFRGWGHVGLYVGGDTFIHAPHSGAYVCEASLSARSNYCGAVRP